MCRRAPTIRKNVTIVPTTTTKSISSQTGMYEPWSPEWFAYCDARYQTFDETDGTFMSNAGYRKLCR